MEVNFELIGCRIKGARLAKKMTQAELAEKIDMSVPYVSYIETAKKRASLKSLIRISHVLEVTIDCLLNGNQINNSKENLAEFVELFEGCNSHERQIIFTIVMEIKKVIICFCLKNDILGLQNGKGVSEK